MLNILKEIRKIFAAEEITRCREEINKENRLAIQLLASAGIPLGIANMVTQSIVAGERLFSLRSSWLLIYFCLLMFIERVIIPEDFRCNTLLAYLANAPVMLVSVLLGSIWDPFNQATTILLFLMALPVFILDYPGRLMAVSGAWSVFFLILSYQVKIPELFHVDLTYVVEFYLASMTVTCVVQRIRLKSLQSLERTQYHLEHDELTSSQNRRALTSRASQYLDKPLLLLLGDLDQLTLFNDFYGHDIGDEMVISFAQILTESFGADHTYRYGGDEMLCIAVYPETTEVLKCMDHCRKQLYQRKYHGQIVTLTCSFGYVTGTPETVSELHEMIQLADIYMHRAQKKGRDQTEGGIFDADSLKAGIIESNIMTNARAYETNQLTGLPTMSYFILRSDELLSRVADSSRHPVVGYLNLFHFRDFNDEFGYEAGDALIQYAAGLMLKHFDNGLVCYITGTKFGILCYQAEAEIALKQINSALQTYMPGFPISMKAGFAEYTGKETVISLLDKATLAHDSILEQRNTFYRLYDEKLDEEKHFEQYIVNHVDEAVERGYLKVYYQPIARTSTGKVCNEEALSRWDDPQYGFLPPMKFIPLLEENHLTHKVTLHVVKQVLADFDRRKESGMTLVPVSINLSRYDFEQCDIVQEITDLVDASGYPRSMIKIEITESAFIKKLELLKREVNRFREQGFEVWMDDFGSEYSTLNLLQELDFDLIKIDMQFMKNFAPGSKNVIIVSDIIDMAKRMGITTLIEGVETEEQYHLLQELGCEKLQGYLFNRPNTLDYIIDRAITHTGLTFENT